MLSWLMMRSGKELFVATPYYFLWDSYIEIHWDGCKE